MLLVSVAYNALVAAFAVGVWTHRSNRTAKVTGFLMIGYAILSMVTPVFFQMDMRGTETTPSGRLHPHMTAVMSLFLLLTMFAGAFLLEKRFRVYTFTTIAILIIFGALTGLQVPGLAAGQSTPWMGFTERINIYATMLWFAVLSLCINFSEFRGRPGVHYSPEQQG